MMKYKLNDCFKRNDYTEGWNKFNETNAIIISSMFDNHYVVVNNVGIRFAIKEEEVDLYFYRLYDKDDIMMLLSSLSDEK